MPSPPGETEGATGESPSAGRAEVAHERASADLTPLLGANLRRLRSRRGLSLERLARASGVSRAMLSQIELGQSTPTVNVVWKIAVALGLPFSALITDSQTSGASVLPASRAKVLTSHDGSFSSRALFPFDRPPGAEFYELRLAPGGCEQADAHAPGTSENLIVASGSVSIEVDGATHRLEPGDAILFEADRAHAYRNAGATEAVMYLVMLYTRPPA